MRNCKNKEHFMREFIDKGGTVGTDVQFPTKIKIKICKICKCLFKKCHIVHNHGKFGIPCLKKYLEQRYSDPKARNG